MFHGRQFLFWLLALAAICLLVFPKFDTLATQEADTPLIRLQYASFDPLLSEPSVPAGQDPQAPPATPDISIVQFSGPVQEEWKAAVEATGARLYGYIPDYAFLARLDAGAAEAARALPFVRWIGAYQPAYRLAASLQPGNEAQASGPVELTVQALPDTDLGLLEAQVQALGGSVSEAYADEINASMRVTIEASQAQALAALDGVTWVEPYFKRELFNDVAEGILNVPAVRTLTSLYGSGQVVAVADTGLDVGTTGAAMSDDFEGRIRSGQAICAGMGYRTTWNDFQGHGTHVSGSILGSGKLSGSNPAGHQYGSSFAGAAPETQLVFQSIDDPSTEYLECIPTNLKDLLFKPAYDAGARIHSDSWGGPTGDNSNPYGGYDDQAQAADNAAWNYKNLLILFAAGNSGTDADYNGVVDPDSLGSPGTAKNVLTVGATENTRPSFTGTWGDAWPFDFSTDPIAGDQLANNTSGMAAFSSRGPADDGRIKPDIVAPGTYILSTRSHDPDVSDSHFWDTYNSDYAYMGGTSMATPLTAGTAALVREWLVEKRGIANPSAALMKAVLLNGASNISPGQYGTGAGREIPASVPNNVTGWGRANLAESILPTAPRQVWLQDTTTGLSTGKQATYTIHVGGAAAGQAAQEAGSPEEAASQEIIEATPVPPAASTPEPPSGEPRKVELSLSSAAQGQPATSVSTNPQAPEADVSMELDDGSSESLLGINDTGGGVAYQFIWLNRFTPAAGEFPFNLEQIQVLFDADGWVFTGAAIDLAVYQDADGNPANGATLLDVIPETVQADDGVNWSVYDLAAPITINGPGDVLIAVINRYVVDGVTPSSYPAALDTNSDQGRSWIGYWVLEPPDPPTLPPDLEFGTVSSVSGGTYSGNWLIRGYGTTTTGATPTFTPSPSPTTSTTPPPGTGGPLRITLAWTDYPGNPAAAKALVNDLDLEVIAPNGTHYKGNAGVYTSGQCLRSGGWDACNNVEGVLIPNTVVGNYTIIVHGSNIPNGPQPFAVVASGDGLLKGNQRVFLPMLRR